MCEDCDESSKEKARLTLMMNNVNDLTKAIEPFDPYKHEPDEWITEFCKYLENKKIIVRQVDHMHKFMIQKDAAKW